MYDPWDTSKLDKIVSLFSVPTSNDEPLNKYINYPPTYGHLDFDLFFG